jgi:hypothetical protein
MLKYLIGDSVSSVEEKTPTSKGVCTLTLPSTTQRSAFASRKGLKPSSGYRPLKTTVLDEGLRSVIDDFASLHKTVEKKTPSHSDKTDLLLRPQLTYSAMIPSAEASIMTRTVRSLFGDKVYNFRLSTVLTMASNGAGNVNSIIAVNNFAGLSEFSALSTIFNEVFLSAMKVRWEPVSRYNGPVGFVNTANVASVPIVCAELQHGAAVYTTDQDAANNFRRKYQNTGVPFSQTWTNVESPATHMLVDPSSTTFPTQNWSTVGNAGNYTGSLQYISNTSPVLPVSAILGTFCVDFMLLFRIRQ